MNRYRVTTISLRRAHYAVVNGVFEDKPLIVWSPSKAEAALFTRKHAAELVRRMRRLRIRTKIEAA